MPIPIVLFPGIMGSRLFFQNSGKFWDPDNKLRMLGWLPIRPFRSDDDNRLTLHASEPAGVIYDTSSNVSQAASDRGWSTVPWSFYGPMLQGLQTRFGAKGDVYAVGYDWRQDIEWLGGYAAEKIQGILGETGATQAIVITHSMGGLVLRSALQGGSINENDLVALLHICIPAAGAVNLYRRMFTGMITPYDGGGSIGDSVFRLILGNNRKGFVGNISGLPGAVQLLPSGYFPLDSHGAFWNAELTGVPFNGLYSSATSPPGIAPPTTVGLATDVMADLQDRISDVANFEAFLGDPAQALHPETWLIYGTAQSTETHIAFRAGVAVPGVDALGDGTVPQVSALALNLNPQRVRSATVEHSMACADTSVLNYTIDILSPYLP
jgi:hypothetical protein